MHRILRRLPLSIMVAGTLTSTSAHAAGARTIATYDQATETVTGLAAGYGWADWIVQRRDAQSTAIVTYHAGLRRTLVPSGGLVPTATLVRADDARGTPTVYLVARVCASLENIAVHCANQAYEIANGHRAHPSWLPSFFPNGRVPGDSTKAFDGTRVVRVHGVTARAEPRAPYAPTGQVCTSTVGGFTTSGQVALPAVPDCSGVVGVAMRGSLATFTAFRPSGTVGDAQIEDFYIADTARPAAGWTRIGTVTVTTKSLRRATISGSIGLTISDAGPLVLSGTAAFKNLASASASVSTTATQLVSWNLDGLGTPQGAVASAPLPVDRTVTGIASPGSTLLTREVDPAATPGHPRGTTSINELPLPS